MGRPHTAQATLILTISSRNLRGSNPQTAKLTLSLATALTLLWIALNSTGQHWTALDSTGQHWTALDSTAKHWTALTLPWTGEAATQMKVPQAKSRSYPYRCYFLTRPLTLARTVTPTLILIRDHH